MRPRTLALLMGLAGCASAPGAPADAWVTVTVLSRVPGAVAVQVAEDPAQRTTALPAMPACLRVRTRDRQPVHLVATAASGRVAISPAFEPTPGQHWTWTVGPALLALEPSLRPAPRCTHGR